MGKFFSRFSKDPVDPAVSSLGNMANFYSLLIFLIAIPFVLIIGLVWLTGILAFNAYIFAGFACLLAFALWRLYRRWGAIKAKMAAQTNGVFTLRYTGGHRLASALPAGRPYPLALEAPAALEVEAVEVQAGLPPERLREELEGFLRLRDEGVISPEEFDRLKASLLQRVSA
jgi:hypothetical protein